MTEQSSNRQFLEKIPLFTDLSQAELDCFAGLLKRREFAKDGTILQQDEPGNALYILLEGHVKVVLFGDSGREIILSTLKERDFFGEMSLLDGAPRSASVVAQTPTKLLVLERGDFIQQVMQNPKIALEVMQEMSRRLREADEKIGSLTLLDVYGRLARLLIQLAKSEGRPMADGILIEKRPTHQDIAAMIGTSRETVSRGLSDLSKRGMIRMSGKQIIISALALEELQDQSVS